VENRLRASDFAEQRGVRVVGLSYPDIMHARVSFSSAAFDSLPGWAPIMALPPAEKMAALSDPARRSELQVGLRSPEGRARKLGAMTVTETYHPSNECHRGRRIGDIAAEEGRDLFEVLCEIVVADELRTGFSPEPQADDDEAWEARLASWTDERVVVGASDGGAHLDILSTFDYPVRFLAMQREHQVLTLPGAIRLLTDVPARLYGLHHRGRLASGYWADLVIFDPDKIATGPVRWRNDLPAGAGRLYAEPEGVFHVIVNGTEIVNHNRVTGERPGRVLRRGRDG
jgi:N-acyl-D-aspartate/D-glutamate deacylase